ncbi:MAG TPA: thiol reductant ABC exporter subunit CydD [Dokdonella sp.]|uniref:thiol reductant ABC exporter subunit CydD n=1 Tax=Dokdonella sp. TaxID=2291710 RepID=UPI002BBF8194|nr:thiol reductant ABC exporter subunit CydD [Dokdonella sp.]HUD42144.1 thiol reductant ABC exporter subunit CydD [Dokdonella sp.]
MTGTDPAAEAAARRWLGTRTRTVDGWTGLAAAAGLAATLAWIGFAALLAAVAAHWTGQPDARPSTPVALVLAPLLLLARSLSLALRDWAGCRASLRLRAAVRDELLDALARLGPLRAAAGSDGALATVVVEQVDALDGYVARYRPQCVVALGVPLLIVLAVLPQSWLAALILAATAPLIPLFMLLVGQGAAAANRRQAEALATLGGRFLDLVRGLPALRLAGRTEWGAAAVRDGAQGYRRSSLRVLRLAFLSSTVLELFASLAIAMVALYLGLALLGRFPAGHYGGPMQLDAALFVLLLAPEFFAPLRQLGADYHLRAQALAAATAIADLLRRVPPPPPVVHGASADRSELAPTNPGGSSAIGSGPAAIEFDQVSLRHGDGRLALDRISFRVAAGERVLLRGASGAGKSSVLALLAGFLAPTEGCIRIDGRDLARLPRSAWWPRLAWLEQRPEWFAASMADNVRVGLDDADPARLWRALTDAGLAADVEALPDGVQTRIDADGGGLSGGQLQRLALARALLRDAGVWLLDEPLAQLDPDTAAELQQTLDAASRGRTLLIASHDRTQATDAWVDRIVTLAAGRIVEDRPVARSAPESR